MNRIVQSKLQEVKQGFTITHTHTHTQTCTHTQAHIYKRSQIHSLTLQTKELRRGKEMNFRANRREELLNKSRQN